MVVYKSFIVGFVSLLLSVACTQQPEQADEVKLAPDAADVSVISGVASKGPISAAVIEIFAFDANDGSESGAALASTTTNANGQWSVSIPAASHTVALLIKSSGGSYLDESDPEPDPAKKRTISFGASDSIVGVLFPGFNTASVTMVTSALVEKSRIEAAGVNFLGVLANNRNIARSALGFDPFTVAAANPLSPATSASVNSIKYAMYLGGMATALNSAAILVGLPLPDFGVVEGFILDMADGRLNGVNQGGAVNVLVNGIATPFPTTIDLNQAIKRFRNNNFAAYAVTPVTTIVAVNETAMATSGVNSNPNAINDTVVTVTDAAVITQNLLVNDTDPDGDGLTISSFTQPANGLLTSNNDGTFTYVPNPGFSGSNIFSYTIDDGRGGTDTAQVIITVTDSSGGGGGTPSSNNLPTSVAGSDQSVGELSTTSLTGSGTDTDGTISGYLWSQVSGTAVTISDSTSAAASFVSPVVLVGNIEVLVFQLAVTDNEGGVALDFVTIIVNPIAIAPTADAGPDQTLNELQPVSLDGSGSSDDRSIASYAWTQIAGTPLVTINNADSAAPDFSGPDIANNTTLSFQLLITDDEGGTATDTVDINLVSLNAGPTVVDDPAITAVEDTSLLITTLLDNDTDGESDPFTIDTVTQGANGTVVIEADDASVTYTPAANFNGVDTFTYTAVDEFGAISSGSATVTVTVSAVNDDPVANTDSPSTQQGFPVTIADLTVNDTDPENDPVSITGVTQPADGVAINNGDGTVTYTPNLTFNGVDTFTYSIVDGNGGSANGTINVTVIADTDGDGVIDTQEVIDGTDPLVADSDNDGFFDGHEKVVGTDPNLNTQFPPTTVISAGNTNNVISVDTTWSLNNAPYWLQSDVSIQSGATLTIEAGVVVKSSLNVDIFVNSGGILNALGNALEPQHVVFSGSLDDNINGDTNGDGVATTPSDADWGGIDYQAGSSGTLRHAISRYAVYCVGIYNSSPIISDVDAGDCSGYAFDVQTTTGTQTTNLNNINIIDYDANGQSSAFSAIRIYSSGSATNIVNLSNLNIDEAGASTNYGLYFYANGGSISGSLDNLVVTDSSNDGLNIYNNGTGSVNLAINDVSIADPGGNGIDIHNISTGVIDTTFDGSNSITGTPATLVALSITNNDPVFLASGNWAISNAGYGLGLTNSDGSFNNFTLDNMTIAGIRLGAASDPLQFSNITLTNAITPYELQGQNLTATIIAGYDFSDASVAKSYIRINGTLLADTTLGVDPLNTVSPASVWRVTSSMTVPAGVTLTVTDDAVLKFDLNTILHVDGTLSVTNAGGGRAIFTSIRDDSVGVDLGDATPPAKFDWGYINVRTNSVIDIDNAIIRYNQYGIYHYNVNSTSFSLTNSTISDTYYYGMLLYASTGHDITWNIDTLTLANIGINTNYHGIYLQTINNATFGGTLNNISISNVTGSGIRLEDTSTGPVNPVISGLTISGSVGVYGVQLIGDTTTTPTFDNSSGSGNLIASGTYNLLLQGVGGSYSDLTLDSATSASIYVSNVLTDPFSWDDASIILTNSPSPYRLLTELPGSIGTFGTADLGYNVGSSTVTQNYLTTGGTLSDTTFVADPLFTFGSTGFNSVWRVVSNLTVPAATTLTVNDGAILKFDLGTILRVDGTLTVGDGNGLGANAIFTSIRDDSVGVDLGDATPPAKFDWGYINIRTNSVIDIDNAIIRYNQYGIYHYNVNSTSFSLTNSTISDTYYYGMQLYAGTGHTITWNIDTLTLDNIGTNTNYHGIYIQTVGNATFDGTLSNISISNVTGSGIRLEDTSTGPVNPVISGLTVGGSVGVYGVQLIGDTTTTPIFDNSSGSGNLIAGGTYNLLLQGVGGSYDNLSLDGATISSLYFDNSANPGFFNAINIILDNSPSPYTLIGMNLPALVNYTAGSGALIEDYVIIRGSMIEDVTLDASPLGGASFWYVSSSDLDVGSGRILAVESDTVIKVANGYIIDVLSGGTLIVNGTAGNEAIITSFTDDNVGVPSASSAAIGDWEGLYFRTGSNATVNYLTTYFGQDGINISNVTGLTFNNLSVNYSHEGLRINASTTSDPIFNNLAINECSSSHLYLEGAGTMAPAFSGTLTITDVNGTNATYGMRIASSDNNTVSNFTVTGSTYAADISGSSSVVLQNNLLRQAGTSGVRVSSSGAPIIQNNIIVNNGGNVSDAAGVYAFSGTNAFINNNLIRHNRGIWGAGIFIRSASPVVQNNLIIENSDITVNSFGGGGMMIYTSSSPTIINNTFADNSSVETTSFGAGLSIQNVTGTVTLIDNILFGNTDGNAAASDLSHDGNGTLVENFNLVGVDNVDSNGANDVLATDPQFTNDGWYLSALTSGEGADSAAIDVGSDLAGNTAIGAGIVILSATTTRSDGVNEGAGSQVDLGYHYPDGTVAAVVNAGNSEVLPLTFTETGNAGGTQVVIVLTPKDDASQDNGAGLKVTASATDLNNLSAVTDLGDGGYQVTYTIPVGDSNDTVTFNVNGVAIADNTLITWIP